MDAVAVRQADLEEADDLVLLGAVEDRGGDVGVGLRGLGVDLMRRCFQSSSSPSTCQPDLASQPRWISRIWPMFIRPARRAVEHHVDRGAVLEERHVLDGRIFEMMPLLP